jgi:hypothetical protein
MKYIITENRLNDAIFKYLDIKYGALEQKRGEYIDIVFASPGKKFGELGWHSTEDLFVSYELRDEISNFFGLKNNNSLLKVIGKWFENRHNLKVTNIPSSHNKLEVYIPYNPQS